MDTLKIFLMNTPELGVLVFILVAVLSTLICYGVARILLISRIEEDSELFARGMITRVGALHALILALMFAQEMADYRDISRIVSNLTGSFPAQCLSIKTPVCALSQTGHWFRAVSPVVELAPGQHIH